MEAESTSGQYWIGQIPSNGDAIPTDPDMPCHWGALAQETGQVSGRSTDVSRFPQECNAADPACPQQSLLALQNSILNELEDVVWSVSLTEQRYLYLNAAVERLYGYPVRCFIEDMSFWMRVIHPDDRAYIESVYQTVRETGHQELEYRIFRADGEVRWVRDRARLVRDEAGTPVRIDGLLMDITEHKRVQDDRQRLEVELRRWIAHERFLGAISQHIQQSLDLTQVLTTAAAELRRLLQTDRVLIYAIEPSGEPYIRIESVVPPWPAFQALQDSGLGWVSVPSDLSTCHTVTAIADVANAELSTEQRAFLDQGQVKAALISPIFQGDRVWGGLIIHHCTEIRYWRSLEVDLVQRLSTKIGIAIHQTTLFQQVQHLNATLESQVEERTRQLQELLTFESLLKRITDKVRSSLDKHQILQTAVEELAIHLNLDACDCAIYDLEQQTSTISYEHVRRGHTALGTIWQMTDFPEFYEQLRQQDVCFQFCDHHQTRGWVAIIACPLWDDRRVLGDIWLVRSKQEWFSESEIRLIQQVVNQCAIAIRQAHLYQEVQHQVNELECLNQLKDDFLSTVSHELRTPIASIKMASQMLEVTLTKQALLLPEDTPLARYLRVLQEECDREIQLVNDLLDLSRLESERVPLLLSLVPLRVWLPHLTESFLPRLQQYQHQLTLAIAEDLPDIVSDTALLERVLMELLNNACKYTPPGEQIVFSAHCQDAQVCIEICNSGVEIPPEARSHLFEKFYRVPNGDPWKQGGTGLGLALVKRIVDELQGTIELADIPGCTAFRVYLPLALPYGKT